MISCHCEEGAFPDDTALALGASEQSPRFLGDCFVAFGFSQRHRPDKINRPSWRRGATLGDWFLFRTCFLSSQASPNDFEIVIVVVRIGEADLVMLHSDNIIA